MTHVQPSALLFSAEGTRADLKEQPQQRGQALHFCRLQLCCGPRSPRSPRSLHTCGPLHLFTRSLCTSSPSPCVKRREESPHLSTAQGLFGDRKHSPRDMLGRMCNCLFPISGSTGGETLKNKNKQTCTSASSSRGSSLQKKAIIEAIKRRCNRKKRPVNHRCAHLGGLYSSGAVGQLHYSG